MMIKVTRSPVLYIQTVGRGARTEAKILDKLFWREKMRMPTIKDLHEATTRDTINVSPQDYSKRCDIQRRAAKTMLNLMQAIEDGKLAVVPVTPVREQWAKMGNAIVGCTNVHHDIISENCYKAAIKAADTQKIMAELWEGE